MADLMRAFVGHRLDGPEAFSIEHLPVPEPAAGQVCVRIEAVGLGFVDGLLVRGQYQWKPPLPYVPGGEIVGTIVATGPGCDGWHAGDRVACWQMGGGLADHALLPASQLVRVPTGVEPAVAAAILLDYLTAQYALDDCAHLAMGNTVLVLGAAGGVGGAAVELASRAGALVIAAVSSPAKARAASLRGAGATLDYTQEAWRDALKGALGGRQLDIVFDPVGGSLTEPAFRSLGKEGRYLVLGFAAGAIGKVPVNLALLKSASLIGVDFRYRATSAPAQVARALAALFDRLAVGAIAPPPIALYRLEDAQAAFAALEQREHIGKVVLVP